MAATSMRERPNPIATSPPPRYHPQPRHFYFPAKPRPGQRDLPRHAGRDPDGVPERPEPKSSGGAAPFFREAPRFIFSQSTSARQTARGPPHPNTSAGVADSWRWCSQLGDLRRLRISNAECRMQNCECRIGDETRHAPQRRQLAPPSGGVRLRRPRAAQASRLTTSCRPSSRQTRRPNAGRAAARSRATSPGIAASQQPHSSLDPPSPVGTNEISPACNAGVE